MTRSEATLPVSTPKQKSIKLVDQMAKEAPHPVPQLPSSDAPSISHSKNTTRHFKEMNALEKQQIDAQKIAEKIPAGLRGQAQNIVAPPRAVQAAAIPQPRMGSSPAPQAQVGQGNVASKVKSIEQKALETPKTLLPVKERWELTKS